MVTEKSYLSIFKTEFEIYIKDLFNSIVSKLIDTCKNFNKNFPDDSAYKDLNSMQKLLTKKFIMHMP